VNLIPFNPVDGLPWKRPDRDAVVVFRQALEARHVTASVRKRKGADIDAACGQLRRQAVQDAAIADKI
jgi:23S rRNA (adenine2503-C2)-methyltransferase